MNTDFVANGLVFITVEYNVLDEKSHQKANEGDSWTKMSRGWVLPCQSAGDGFLWNAPGHVEGILSRPGTDVHSPDSLASNLSPRIRTVNVHSRQEQGQGPPCLQSPLGCGLQVSSGINTAQRKHLTGLSVFC